MDDLVRFNSEEKYINTSVISEQIAKHTEEFIARGGMIDYIKPGTIHTKTSTGFSVVRGTEIDNSIRAQRQRDVMMLKDAYRELNDDQITCDIYYMYGKGGGYFFGKTRLGTSAGQSKKELIKLVKSLVVS